MLTDEQKEIITKWYEEEIKPIEREAYNNLDEEGRKNKLNWKFSFCPCYWSSKPNKQGEIVCHPDQSVEVRKFSPIKFFDNSRVANIGVYPPLTGYLYYDFDKPSPVFKEKIQQIHGHYSKKEDCGHLLMRTKLTRGDVANKTFHIVGIFDGEVARHGLKPVFTPGTIKVKGGPITHRSNGITKTCKAPAEIDDHIKEQCQQSSVKLNRANKATYKVIKDKQTGQTELGEGGRNFFLAVSIGRRLNEIGIVQPHIRQTIQWANEKFCNPEVDENKVDNIFKQMTREAEQNGIRSENHLIWMDDYDGPYDVIKKGLLSLGWDFRTLRGGLFQYRKNNSEWKSAKLGEIISNAGEELENYVRVIKSINVRKVPLKKEGRDDDKNKDKKPDPKEKENETTVEMDDYKVIVFMRIEEFDYADKKVEKAIKNWAVNNRYDIFGNEVLKPVRWDAKRLARKYGKGNWEATLDDFIIWSFMDRFCQRHCPKNEHGVDKFEGYGEQPPEYTRWQLPLIMLQTIWRMRYPGYPIDEFIWNIGPEGTFKNKSREWLFPEDIRSDCYMENLTYSSKTEAATNRKRRSNVISEFDEAETIRHADLKRYFSAGKVLHEEKYEELNVKMQWMDAVVFSTNKADALPPVEFGNRRFWTITQYPKDEITKMIYEDGMSKDQVDKMVLAMFDENRQRLWTEAFALYLMGIKPESPPGLEAIRIKAVQKASGLEEMHRVIRNMMVANIKNMTDNDKKQVFIADLAELLGKNSREIGTEARKIHIELGGNGEAMIRTNPNTNRKAKCFVLDGLKAPEEESEVTKDVKEAVAEDQEKNGYIDPETGFDWTGIDELRENGGSKWEVLEMDAEDAAKKEEKWDREITELKRKVITETDERGREFLVEVGEDGTEYVLNENGEKIYGIPETKEYPMILDRKKRH